MACIKVYYSSVSGNLEIKASQRHIFEILEAKKISFEKLDISASEEEKGNMRKCAGDPKALPPQICNGEQYCGNFEAFSDANEDGTLLEFLKLKA